MKQFQTLKADLRQTRIIETATSAPFGGDCVVVKIEALPHVK